MRILASSVGSASQCSKAIIRRLVAIVVPTTTTVGGMFKSAITYTASIKISFIS